MSLWGHYYPFCLILFKIFKHNSDHVLSKDSICLLPNVHTTVQTTHRPHLSHTFQEMKLVVPNSQRINRGGMILNELVETCRSHAFTDIVVLHEHRGEPGRCGRETGKCGEREEGWKCGA